MSLKWHTDGICGVIRLEEDFDTIGYFRPYVQQWLINTDNMTGSWVKSVSVQSIV